MDICKKRKLYDPTVGRFISKDPLGMIDGPNMYAYVNNNPVNLIDPWGLCKTDFRVKSVWDFFKEEVYKDVLRIFEGTQWGRGVGSSAKVKLPIIPVKIEIGMHAIEGERVASGGIEGFFEEKIEASLQVGLFNPSLAIVDGEVKVSPVWKKRGLSTSDFTTIELSVTLPNPYTGQSVNAALHIHLGAIFRRR
ncbi:RHS repeat-associated core domain-containing protein [bacterium]|nr:RHS repeat-associated core domain-containing protein [bacterium]